MHTIKLNTTAKARLAKVARWLEDGAPHIYDKSIEGFNMIDGVEWVKDPITHECGSVCCIAGALVQFYDPVEAGDIVGTGKSASWIEVSGRAQELLGVEDYEDIVELFNPQDLSSSEMEGITPAQAARCIRHLIKTGEIDWERAMEEPA